MAFEVEKNGNITLVCGDSGSYCIDGLPIGDYTVYFAIQDEDRRPIGDEISVKTNSMSGVAIELPAKLTDLLTVDEGDETAVYYFGVKLCNDDGYEDTLLLGDSKIGDLNTITVYPKKVEGVK